MRRRYKYATRKKARRTSKLPKGVIPDQESFSGADLMAITGCTAKTLTAWRRIGLLPRVPAKGLSTVYGRGHVRRALAIARAGVQAAKLPRFAEMIPLVLGEAPLPQEAPPPPDAAARVAALVPSSEPDGPLAGVAWKTIELLPGLELRLAEDAPPIMRSIVREVAKRFGRVV